MVALRGAVAILFGILACLWPGAALLALTLLFGIFAIVDCRLGHDGRRHTPGWITIAGVLGIAVGIAALVGPTVTMLVLVLLIAAWSIARGLAEVCAAVQLRQVIEQEWGLALGGVAPIAVQRAGRDLPRPERSRLSGWSASTRSSSGRSESRSSSGSGRRCGGSGKRGSRRRREPGRALPPSRASRSAEVQPDPTP